ncbi:MAG: hypothetical protein ACSLE5_13920 [Porticoccaceae bacterium]
MRLNSHTLALLAGEFKHSLTKAIAGAEQIAGSGVEPFIQGMVELRGVAAMIELAGARRLIEEIIACAQDLRDGKLSVDQLQPVLSPALTILPLYVQHIVQAERDSPCLLLPEINVLRKLRSLTPVYEYQLLTDVPWPPFPIGATVQGIAADQLEEMGRLRHFYQLGLLDIIRGNGSDKAFMFIARATDRLQNLVTAEVERSYWSLFGRVIRAFATQKLRLLPERVRLFSAVEQQLRLLSSPQTAGKNPYPEGLWRVFVALYALTAVGGEQDRQLRNTLGIPDIGVTDADIAGIRQHLLGEASGSSPGFLPGLADVANSLRYKLDALQDTDTVLVAEEMAFLRGTLADLANVCAAHHLPSLARRFHQHEQELTAASEAGGVMTVSQREAIADSILSVEALVADFWERMPTPDQLAQWDARPLAVILQTGIIRSAQRTLLGEMSISLKKIKGGLDSLVMGMTAATSTTEIDQAFGLIRANAFMLDMRRLEELAQRSRQFVRGRSLVGGIQGFGGPTAETFADAVISIEYYLDNYRPGEPATEAALNLADQCLTTLGV